MKKLSKYEIATMIEDLPGNTPWGANSLMTTMYNYYTRQELVDKYNNLIDARKLNIEKIN